MTDTPGLSVPLQIPLSKFEKQLAKAEAAAVKRAQNIERKFNEANGRSGQALTKSAAASAQVFERAIQKETRAFQQLKASVDPAYAAQRRYEAAVRQVEAAVRMGAVSQKEANAVLQQARAAHLGLASAATASAGQAGTFGRGTRGMGAAAQNASYQISDMMVQLEMGTNPMRVMGQQLPQLAMGFGMLPGPVGRYAVLLGTIAAIGFPVAAILMSQGEAAEESADKIEDFADAYDRAEAAINRTNAAVSRAAAGDLDALREMYGEVTIEIKSLIDALARLEAESDLRASRAAIDQFFTENTQVEQLFQALEDRQASMADLSREIAAMEDQQQWATYVPPENARILEEMRADLEAMERMEGISEDFSVDPSALNSIRDARDALQQASEIGDMEAMVDAIANMRAVLAAIPDGPLADMGDELALAEDLLRQSVANSERLKNAASGISFDGAASSASRMADEISRAADAMYELRAQGLTDLETAQIRYEYRDDPVGRAGALAGAEFDRRVDPLAQTLGPTAGTQLAAEREAYVANAREIARLQEASRPQRTSGGRSGGGSRSREEFDLFANSEQEIIALERQIEMVGKSRREIVALTAKYELLDEARERGIDLNQRSTETGRTLREEIDAQAEAIANLTIEAEQYAAQADFMADLSQDLKDGLIDAIIEGKNFGEVLENVTKQLAKAALQAALFGDGPLAGLFGGGGLLGGLFGGGGLGFFARGTDYAPGGAAIVGEEGPELVHLPRGSKVIPNHKLGQGGGRSQVDVFVHPSGEFDTRVQQISGDVAVNVSSQMISENNRQVSQMQRR
ncbi:phage tail length tape measure family protein [Donghicola eburneus]|uniref:phage tail length tape measure family protein n=1 Tax=Donghicola eburneus TaxID=393278 RepID=UPI0008E49D86|nr:phage tail length tape measure family protein [Donghicola eburneus]SFQ52513.1 Prophage tail length tape measure protein [Donghicola eburneus]